MLSIPAITPGQPSGGLREWLKRFAVPLVMLTLAVPLSGSPPRGIWWWASPEHPWGSAQVLGDAAKEAALLGFLTNWKIGLLYTCFNEQIRSQPDLIRRWNERVHAAGIKSQLLLSENTWIDPKHRPNLLKTHIQRGLIEFNRAAANPQQRFDGVHLDIEPHGLPGWTAMTPDARKQLLFQLRDTLKEVRSYLNEQGAAAIPVFADLPVWFDQIGKPVGWTSVAERDAWFADLGKSLAGISLMAYERNSVRGIDSGVEWEFKNFQREVRIGLEVSIGPGKTWKSRVELMSMIRTQESATPPRPVGIHDLVQFHDAVTSEPD